MGLAGRLGKAVLKRIEASPAVQAQIARSERTMPVLRVARRAAYSSLDDEAAKAKVRDGLEAEPAVVEEALVHFRGRDDYIGDRTYRLLAAAAVDTTVAPIAPEHAELFAREEEIGRLPMKQAFQRLAEIEPGLLDVKARAEVAQENGDQGGCGLPRQLKEPLGRFVGGGARSDEELLHGTLATSIVHQYLEILTGNSRLGTPDVAYFDSPIKHFVASHVLFDRRRRRGDL